MAGDKPRQVVVAARALWASLALGVVIGLVNRSSPLTQIPLWFLGCVIVVALAFMAFLIHHVSAGRNWARVALSALFAPVVIVFFPNLFLLFQTSVLAALLSLVQMGLELFALYLLFTRPGAAWFKPISGS